jgi:hypothetical protein
MRVVEEPSPLACVAQTFLGKLLEISPPFDLQHSNGLVFAGTNPAEWIRSRA